MVTTSNLSAVSESLAAAYRQLLHRRRYLANFEPLCYCTNWCEANSVNAIRKARVSFRVRYQESCFVDNLMSIIGAFVEHNRYILGAVQHSIIGRFSSIICLLLLLSDSE